MAHFESQPKKMTKKPAVSVEKLLLSRQEAAELLSISRRALDYLIANRAINVRRIGSRVLIPSQDLLRFASVDHPERLVG
jgi:excisionase family DNA binding protein